MSEIKLVLTDIDGTLVPIGQDNPTLEVRQAINAVQDAGVELTAATGRPYEMMQPLFEHLGFRDLGIFDAGATIRDIHTGDLVWNNWLDEDRIRSIAGLILPHVTWIDFYPTYNETPVEQVNLQDPIEPAPYVFGFIKIESRQEILEGLADVPDISFHMSPARADLPGCLALQVTDINSDKFHAVNALRQIVHSEKSQTLAIGDSTNDLPLFQNAGLKIAMGNAMEELKQEADFIVGDVDQNGFAEAMRRFVLRT